jgi:hypothetical protein
MCAFWRKKLRVTDPEARDRIATLLRKRGPLLLEAAFGYVSSDFYVLAGPEDVSRVFDWFSGRGGTTPLYVDPAKKLASGAKALLETDTSAPGCGDQIKRAVEDHTILLEASPPGLGAVFQIIDDDEDWAQVSATMPSGTPIRAYDALALRGRRSALVVWAD